MRRSRIVKDGDSDSVIEFAEAGDYMASCASAGSSKAYALHDISPRISDLEGQSVIRMQKETIVDFGKA
jgi:hypothetical protein